MFRTKMVGAVCNARTGRCGHETTTVDTCRMCQKHTDDRLDTKPRFVNIIHPSVRSFRPNHCYFGEMYVRYFAFSEITS